MKNLRGTTQKTENNDDCRVLAPFVMTLFDGEADEIEARRARAHLLVCQTCANRWLDWNRSRDLLLHSAPVPAPPPQLLWRVLMACRLSKTPQPVPTATPNPASLSAQILARTTRAVPSSVTQRATPRRIIAPFSFPALAAPALCIWMLLLQRDVWLAPTISTPNTASSDSLVMETAPRSPIPAAKTTAAKRASIQNGLAARRPNLSAASRATPVEARAIPARSAGVPVLMARPIAQSVAATQALRVIEANFSAPSSAAWESASLVETTPPSAALPRQFEAPIVTPVRASRRLPITRLATLSGPNRVPRLRPARWQSMPLVQAEISSVTRLTATDSPTSSQVLRVALPNATAPQPARLLAENFDSDDVRIEEARSVVDDFRAAVEPDESNAEAAFDDEENTG